MTRRQGDGGYTLIELLLVIVVLGILATVVVAAAGGFAAEAEDSGCLADSHILQTATEAFFAQKGLSAIPDDLTESADRFEEELVRAGFLRRPSGFYDLDEDGELSPASDSPCDG